MIPAFSAGITQADKEFEWFKHGQILTKTTFRHTVDFIRYFV